jgi:hypothetical protein
MSIPVPVEGIRAALAERGNKAYLLTVSEDARPHAVHGALAWEGDRLVLEAGKRTVANAGAHPHVSLLSPGATDDDYSLIIDGTAAVEGQRVMITPTKGVLHRPAPSPDPTSSCSHDCVPLTSGTDGGKR